MGYMHSSLEKATENAELNPLECLGGAVDELQCAVADTVCSILGILG